ncbi:Protein-L-isoaspartate O-methyltransferase domain-containing protein [Seminavis robusta]|uniref:Protein-L-isoaspartate O-methyltransferase domain-containing protein n=1 Tax=Seminavis robusta TaxID=568900 RepID=A0A9N8DUH2_9STRA|nr:Protein-L-isoaspartate O-methyltransferase domain-containing protein [Seminavis robusta]|eukprot:Sro285_g108110.1 Protein-L-isoaspartate O-methyltransferase domain-containing protein (534) ;mRNA; f:33126-35521
MAWRSSGTTNDEMVDNLKRFGVISTPAVEEAFRQVDRAFFVPPNQRDLAHSDQPLREGNLHISAPHIYGSVLEALELTPQSSLSFLNVGSGTGYMSCIVASVLGCHSNNYGIEVFKDVVEHSKEATVRWKASIRKPVPHIEWVHGNALNINPDKGEAVVGFDRIYIGASVDKEDLPKIANLLRPGGILVGPVEDELMKVTRIGTRTGTRKNSIGSEMETDDPNPLPPSEFSLTVLSGVRFATLLANPNISTVLPSTVWNPSIHYQYPDSFRNSCREILLCSNAPRSQKPRPVPRDTSDNVAGLLPRVLWMEILSYTHRDWFESPESETEFLRRRLREEQESSQRAHNARMEAEARCQLAEEERDVYRVLARRYQLRLEAALRRNGRDNHHNNHSSASDIEEDEEEEGEARAMSGREQAVIFGLGAMLRSIQYESGGDDDEDEEEDDDDIDEDDEDEGSEPNEATGRASGGNVHMEEDGHEELNEEMDENDGDDDDDSGSVSYFPLGTHGMTAHSTSLIVRPQRRTVSITAEDL